MKRHENKWLVESIIFTAALVSLAIIFRWDLDVLQKVFSILGSLSLGVALMTYFYKKKQDRTVSAIDQISFFREKIITQNNQFVDLVRSIEGSGYEFARVGLDEPTIECVRRNFASEFGKQDALLNKREISREQTNILNMLEELALKIYHFQTSDHQALVSIKAPYVELIETHAVVLLLQRHITTGLPTYQKALDLYLEWKDDVDRRSPNERLREILSSAQ